MIVSCLDSLNKQILDVFLLPLTWGVMGANTTFFLLSLFLCFGHQETGNQQGERGLKSSTVVY